MPIRPMSHKEDCVVYSGATSSRANDSSSVGLEGPPVSFNSDRDRSMGKSAKHSVRSVGDGPRSIGFANAVSSVSASPVVSSVWVLAFGLKRVRLGVNV